MPQKNSPSQVLLFSQPRTGCNLLERMLSKQSQIHTYLGHPFGISGRHPRQWLLMEPLTTIPDDLRRKHEAQIAKGEKLWRETFDLTQSHGKAMFTHFHPIFALKPEEAYEYLTSGREASPSAIRNPLSVSDDLLLKKGSVPILTIRNPRLQVPSFYRLSAKTLMPAGANWADSLVAVSGRWSRLLHDWYASNGVKATIVDADDYMSCEAFVRYLCEVSGLNPDEALVKWEKTDLGKDMSKTQKNHATIQETLFASQGPQAGRAAKNLDLEAEEKEWDSEFGSETAEMLRGIVKDVWSDYEYLRERRLALPGSKL